MILDCSIGKLVGEEFGFYVGVISQFEKVLQASCTNVEKTDLIDSRRHGNVSNMEQAQLIQRSVEQCGRCSVDLEYCLILKH